MLAEIDEYAALRLTPAAAPRANRDARTRVEGVCGDDVGRSVGWCRLSRPLSC